MDIPGATMQRTMLHAFWQRAGAYSHSFQPMWTRKGGRPPCLVCNGKKADPQHR